MKSFIAIIAASALSNVAAHPEYVTLLPNGANVAGVAAVGHVDVAGGGPRNEFGTAFAAAGAKWTKELCAADSDGDGQTNGQELGDPCCVWTSGSTPLLATASAPGDATKMADPTTWANVKCDGEMGSASIDTSDVTLIVPNATANGLSPKALSPKTEVPLITTIKPNTTSSAASTTMTMTVVVAIGFASLS